MSTPTRTHTADPLRPSFLEQLYQGRFRWDLVRDFPVQDASDAAIGDELVAELLGLLDDRVDPEVVDRTEALPDGLLAELAERGFFRLQAGPEAKGRELSQYNTFRTVVAAAGRSTPVALSIAVENAIGAAPYLSVVPEGPLRDLVREHVAGGGFSASAETEPQGAGNRRRATTARRVPGTDDYLLNGSKVFVGHAPIAGLVNVSATVTENGEERIRRFFVSTDSPGVTAGAWHRYMGVRGFPNGWLRFDDVRVPGSRMLAESRSRHEVRVTPASAVTTMRGRLYLIGAPSLAIATLCVQWARDFLARRRIDDRGLAEYEEPRRQLAESLADTFAIETVAQWCLLPGDQHLPVNTRFEQNAAKNATSLAAWRVADRTMSLLAGEGYETSESKAERGVPAVPVERYFRDLRNLRISGGVDFNVDHVIARMTILAYYYPEPDHADELDDPAPDGPRDRFEGACLGPRNLAHLRWAAKETRDFGRTCLALARGHTREALSERQRVLVLLAGIARELLTAALTLARASALTRAGSAHAEQLADVFCGTVRHRVADLRAQLAAELGDPAAATTPADGTGLVTAWCEGPPLDHMTTDAQDIPHPAARRSWSHR